MSDTGWIKPEDIDQDLWKASLLPHSKFIENFGYKGDEWRTTAEYVINTDADQRMTIKFEQAPAYYCYDLGRSEQLMEQDVDVFETDAKEFAQNLIDTLFYHTSPFEQKVLVKMLIAKLDEFDQRRRAKYPDIDSYLDDVWEMKQV